MLLVVVGWEGKQRLADGHWNTLRKQDLGRCPENAHSRPSFSILAMQRNDYVARLERMVLLQHGTIAQLKQGRDGNPQAPGQGKAQTGATRRLPGSSDLLRASKDLTAGQQTVHAPLASSSPRSPGYHAQLRQQSAPGGSLYPQARPTVDGHDPAGAGLQAPYARAVSAGGAAQASQSPGAGAGPQWGQAGSTPQPEAAGAGPGDAAALRTSDALREHLADIT